MFRIIQVFLSLGTSYFHEKSYVGLAWNIYYSILNKLFFMHGLYSLDLGSMLKVTLSVLLICMGTLVGQAKAVISGRLCSLLAMLRTYWALGRL